MKRIKVVSFGLGPIGLRAAALAASKDRLEIVGAVDIDESLVGKDLLELTGETRTSGIRVSSDAAEVIRGTKPDVVIHCTSSFIPAVLDQYLLLLEHGVNVVSSTEEMLWPTLRRPDLAQRIHEAAMGSGATILGTGVNPGFVMDLLPAFATSVCRDVKKILCRRHVDASNRRGPFQKKIGAGLEESVFRELAGEGKLGHIGLRESVALLGAACGFDLDDIGQSIEPVLADRDLETPHVSVQKGQVAGIDNRGWGKKDGETLVEMDLKMYVGCPEPRDEAILDSDPPMHIVIPRGTFGDTATAAMLVSCIPGVVSGAPGLKTMLDLPVPHILR